MGLISGNGIPAGGLPDSFYGSATVTSQGGGVAMVVNESGSTTANGASQSGTYSAAPAGNGSIGLPVIARNGSGAIGGPLMTGATLLNVSGQSVSGTIQYYNNDGTSIGTAKPFSIAAHASLALYQGDNAQGLTDGTYGTALITETSGSDLIMTTNAQSASFFYTYTEPSNLSAAAVVNPVPTATGSVTPVPTTTPVSGGLDSEEAAFLVLINQYRQSNGLGTLTLNTNLVSAAKWMSQDMANKNYFSHTDSLGRDPFVRMAAFGYNYPHTAGENIAAGMDTAQAAFTAWKNSPGHNANMLGSGYTVIGIGRAYNSSSTYGWYWTTDFGG
jgi:uncharacterized protein YkwD